MRRETQNVLLVLLGGALLKLAWSGTYLRYVKPSLLPLLIAAGVVIVALGVIAILRDLRAADPHPPGCAAIEYAGHGGDQGDHGEHGGRSPWLLLLPVLAIFLVSPPALGADAVARSAGVFGAGERAPSAAFPPLPDGPAPALRMGDFVTRTVWDDADSLRDREVRLTGFIVHTADGATHLARLVIACCAADATPVRVALDGRHGLAELPQDGWFEVRGRVVPGSATPESRFVPTFVVTDLHPVPSPAEPYEY